MNRISKAMYTRKFREETVKLAMTDGVGVSEAGRTPTVNIDEDLGELGAWRESR